MLEQYSFLNNKKKINVLKTGIEDFDKAMGGGLLKGRITELVGEPDVGKTKLLFDIIESLKNQDIIISYMATSTNSLDYLRARKLHEDSKLAIFIGNDGEKIIKYINETIGYVDLFILDNIADILTDSEKGKFNMNMQQEMPKLLNKINTILYGEDAAFIAVNHFTYKNNQSISKWNNVFQKYCSVRIKLSNDNKFILISHKLYPSLIKKL
jgi:predicted ATP-dependent serine protease